MTPTSPRTGGDSQPGSGLTEVGSGSKWPDWFSWLCLVGFSLVSIAALLPLLASGRTLTGADGLFPPDQLQYLTWIREASNHLLIGNRFDFQPDSRVFLHPGFLLSGLVHRVTGLDLQTSYLLLWKPLAVGVGFFGCWAYTRRLLTPGWPQRVGLFICLFAVMPWSGVAKLTGWGGAPRQYTLDFISGEMWSGQTLFGYMLTATAVFMLPLVLLGVGRVRTGRSSTLLVAACCAAGAWVMWLQPWQGAELIAILVAAEAWFWIKRSQRPSTQVVLIAAVTGLPAIYYAVIAAVDDSWRLAGQANAAGAQPLWDWPLWAVGLTLAPLALFALAALKDHSGDWQQIALRMWPFAVLLVYFQPFGTFPYHALQGLTIPLGVLAVQAFTSHRPRVFPRPKAWWVVPALVFLTVPGTVHKVNLIRESIHKVSYPYYLFDGEQKALAFLAADPQPGGVLADSYGGLLIPPFTGRETFLGPFSWTPDWQSKASKAGRFFVDQMSTDEAVRFVRSTGARFVFQGCAGRVQPPRSLDRELSGLVASTHDFGCARVYVLRPSPESDSVSSRVGGPDH